MLFSKEPVAAFLHKHFEPAWQSVRAVPVVRIDFGGGRVLTRTLNGNILTAVCTPDGLLLDALPGIYAEKTYLDRLDQLRLLAKAAGEQPAAKRGAWVRAYHARQADAIAKKQPPVRFAESLGEVPITKALIERPVKKVLLVKGPPAAPAKDEAPALAKDDVASWKALADDTRLNETTRRRQVHELLAKQGPVAPAKVTKAIYKDVLHADLDDPYLGLGKELFGSYPFAAEDAGR